MVSMTNKERCRARYRFLNSTPEKRAEYLARREWEYVKGRLESDGDFDASKIRTPCGIVCYAACCLMWVAIASEIECLKRRIRRERHRVYGAKWRSKRTPEQIARDRARSLKSAKKHSDFVKSMVMCNYPKPPKHIIDLNRKRRQKEMGWPKKDRTVSKLSPEALERRRKWHREHMRHKRATCQQTRIICCLRSRVLSAIKTSGSRKSAKTADLLGCSIQEFKAYMESKFKPGMSWENHSKDGWHIDHILPCASFDLTDPEQQKRCFHFTNLQPLWATENRKKSAKVDSPLTPAEAVAV